MKYCLFSSMLATVLLLNSPLTLANSDIKKPRIVILATGGTIAGSSTSNTDLTNYKAAEIGVDLLINAVPEMKSIATVTGEQHVNIDSSNMDSTILLSLSKRAKELLNIPENKGIVITHGTDTMEETAFFLDLTLKSDKPVVLVGSMRPATAISSDGPLNLLNAVVLAADENARFRGAMVVLNDRIGSAFYISKTNTTMTDTFKAYEQGYLGAFIDKQPKFYYQAAQPTGKPFFDVSKITILPKVDILYSYQDQDSSLLKAAINNGAKGIVIAGTGNGSVPENMNEEIEKAITNGIPVIRSTRTGMGFVTPGVTAINSGIYNPSKARILLSLALAEGASMEQIKTYFNPNLK